MPENVIREKADNLFKISDFFSYPDSFYGKIFTNKTTNKDILIILANYPEGEFTTPDEVIKKSVGPFIKCQSPKIPDGEKDEMYEFETFSGCSVEGSEVEGAVYTTGGFYSVLIYEKGVSETERELASNYDRSFMDRLCAQDCIGMMDVLENKNPAAMKSGYTVLPSFSYPLEMQSYMAKTYIKPSEAQLYSYQLTEPEEEKGSAENGIKNFCGQQVSINKNGAGYEFSNCLSKQNEKPIKTSGVLVWNDKKKINVLSMWSENMSEADRKMFDQEVSEWVVKFDPKDFE